MKRQISFFLLFWMVINLGYSEDVNDLSCIGTFSYEKILDAFDVALLAGQTWGNDPSSTNCQAWENATNDYLNAVEQFDVSDCQGISQ